MANSLQDEETPLDQEIVQELVSLTPEWWDAIELEVMDTTDGDVEKYSHVIKSLQGHADYIAPSDLLFDATYRLAQLFKKYGKKWKRVTYRVTVEDTGDIQYKADFEY